MAIVAITGEITAATAASVERASGSSRGEPLTIVIINSPGGDIGPCRSTASAVRRHPGNTIGRAYGRCDSGASLVLGACKVRIGATTASFTLHETAISKFELTARLTASHLRNRAATLAESDRDFRAMMAADIGCSVTELERIEISNTTLDGRGALSLGLVTRLIDDVESTQVATARRANRVAARTPTIFTNAEIHAMMRGGMSGRSIGLAPHVLRRMLRTSP